MSTDLTQIRAVKDFSSLVEYLRDKLDWQFESDDVEDLTFDYEPEELGLDAKSAIKIKGIKQLRPFNDDQPWGIFYVYFDAKQLPVGALRGVLRGLVAKKRASANPSGLATWRLENLLFICTSKDYQNFNFAYFRGEQTQRAVLSMFGWHQGDTHLRTLAEYNLPSLRFPDNPADAEDWLSQWRKAFDVEAVTDKFFGDYKRVFEAVEAEVKKSIKQAEQARLYTQRLFNRLMFLYFIQKKGWLEFEGDKNYLRALFEAAEREGENFLRERLYWLFFYGMSNVGESREVHSKESLRERRGDVPYLNGGLFDLEDEYDERGKVEVSNKAFRGIFDLFERYNFTVEESTPLDVQVAVDPEMLGKVFEELVTGRHESGSYYTPRQIVSFMCREALKHYLAGFEAKNESVERFVDEGDAEGLSDPESVLEGLKNVRVCDPACGSGAYLLGMMQELVRLRGRLFVAQRIGDDSAYKIKRSIIENNLYGVDKDQFAVQIAALRLWLSLAIDSERPQPLPNLDFKIECGDSLTAPAPTSAEKSLFFNREQRIREYAQLKGRYMKCTDGEEKRQLRARIDLLRAELAADLKHSAPRPSEQKIAMMREHAENLAKEIRRSDRAGDKTKAAKLQKELQTIKRQLAVWEEEGVKLEPGFDWAVEFAEVFVPEARERWRIDDLHPLLNDFRRQGTLIEESAPDERSGGFDIILANPPYISALEFATKYPAQERARLNEAYQTARGSYDLYVLFYERSVQLLRKNGLLVLINPNKFLSAKYAVSLREFILTNTSFLSLTDISGIKIFKEASVYPVISILKVGVTDSYKIRLRLPKVREMEQFDLDEFNSIEVENQRLRLLPEFIWGFLLSNNITLLEKVIRDSKPLVEVGDVNATSTAAEADQYGAYIQENKTKDSLKVINTGTIDKYAALWGKRAMTHAGNRFITPYLPLSKARVNQRRKAMYETPKIIFAKMARECEAFLDKEGEFASLNTNCFYNPKAGVDIRHIAAFCNSRMFMFFYEQFFGALRMSGGYFQFQAPQLRVIPVRKVSQSTQKGFTDLVDQIIAIKREDPTADTSKYEVKIDRLFYQLYELTTDEIGEIEEIAQ